MSRREENVIINFGVFMHLVSKTGNGELGGLENWCLGIRGSQLRRCSKISAGYRTSEVCVLAEVGLSAKTPLFLT